MSCTACETTEWLTHGGLDEEGKEVVLCEGCLTVLRHFASCKKITRKLLEEEDLSDLTDDELFDMLVEFR